MQKKLFLSPFMIAFLGVFFLNYTRAEVKNNTVVKNSQEKNIVQSKQEKDTIAKADTLDLFVIDSIEAVLFGQENTEIITLSDLERPSLSGAIRTMDDIIFEYMVYFDAQAHKMLPDDESVDRSLSIIAHENNLQTEELALVFGQAGMTYSEGRDELKKLQSVNGMLDFKIRQNLIVSRKNIESYYYAHPEIEQAHYYLEYALVPFSSTKEKQKLEQDLIGFSKTGKGIAGIQWSKPFWVSKSDVAEGKDFLFTMNIGGISKPQKTAAGFELYRLKDKKEEHLKTLDERRSDIIDVLRRPKYVELLEDYKHKLYNLNSVLYF